MFAPKVYFVHLRRPRRNDPTEQRDDPFYEFGSFGCTGCHSRNLFHQRHAEELEGARLAFAQGGPQGFRLVFVTTPIKLRPTSQGHCEAKWMPAEMPFKYREAPILVYNRGRSDFPSVEQFARNTRRTTVEGGLSSKLRSRVRPMPAEMAKEVIAMYERRRAEALPSAIAATYAEALPYPPPKIDDNRNETYQRLTKELSSASDVSGSTAQNVMLAAKTHAQFGCGVVRRPQSDCTKRRRN